MSLINDALTKIEAERAEEAAAIAAGLSPVALAERRRAARRHKSLRPAILGSLGLLVVFAAPIAFLIYHNTTKTEPPATPRAPTIAAAPTAEPPPSPVASPPSASVNRSPSTSESPPPAPSTADYALAGMTSLGRETLLGITRVSDHRSTWISLGNTVGEITAVSYDPAKEEAVIRVNGRNLTIGLAGTLPAAARAAE